MSTWGVSLEAAEEWASPEGLPDDGLSQDHLGNPYKTDSVPTLDIGILSDWGWPGTLSQMIS